MRKIFFVFFSVLAACCSVAAQEKELSDDGGANECREYSKVFQNVKAICDKDNGKLWGVNLYAPTLFIDADRNVWSNQKDNEGNLLPKDGCYVGEYPNDKNIANSTTDVFGQKWVMLALPLPTDPTSLYTLICHEMFHYWQDSLGHAITPYDNAHMDDKDARVLLKLEWNALHDACLAKRGRARKAAIRDGLVFRKLRQEKYSGYYCDETAFEVQEGLPQYTGRKLAAGKDALYLNALGDDMESYMGREELVRSYAYLSGVILGYLLDKSGAEWRPQVNGNSDLGQMLQEAYHIDLPKDMNALFEEAKAQYGYDEIMTFENRRDSIKAIEKQRLAAMFTQNVKRLPLNNMQISFDPNTVVPLEGIGSIYKRARIIDDWGILETIGDGMILISEDWRTLIVPFADSATVNGNVEETGFWKLTKPATN